MLADIPGSRPSGDPDAVETLAKRLRHEAAMLHAVPLAGTGSWRGFGAETATDHLQAADVKRSTVVDELRELATALDRMADDLRHDQRAWDRAQERREDNERNHKSATAS
jgi:hypothetical protein